MTEPAEQQSHHHLKTSGSPSGGRSGDASEHHPPACNRGGAPENGDRGRQREHKQQQQQQQQQRRRAGNCEDINREKLWQVKGGRREVCPALAAGNELQKCPIAPQQQQQSDAHGGDRPLLGTLNQVRDENLQVDSDTGMDARLGKKRHRRRTSKKKRHWKPYNKLSWEEKKALEERETARASRMREEMFAKGLPVAPYNTTQFLMDEHDREEPDLNTEIGVRARLEDTGSEEDFFFDNGGNNNNNNNDYEDDDGGSGGGGGSDGIGRPGNAGGEFLQRDFSETYEMYHVESLQNMTKQELVQEYLELEKCMSRLEEENNRLRRAAEPDVGGVESSLVRLKEMERELERLRAQNSELLLLNQPAKERGQVGNN
ncbi:unnamed protein product [Ophioblennius macclurei]